MKTSIKIFLMKLMYLLLLILIVLIELLEWKRDFANQIRLKICIDHHQDPEEFVDHQFIDTDYCATGQIIFDFIKQTKIVELDFEIAEPIYAAIMTDTGSFRFDRTTSEVHNINC